MHRIHGGFTASFRLTANAEKEENKINNPNSLSGTLALLHKNGSPGPPVFDGSATTLFLQGVVLPADKKRQLPLTFVLSTTYCGPLKTHLYDLINAHKTILVKLL